jgi:hypothetical protein
VKIQITAIIFGWGLSSLNFAVAYEFSIRDRVILDVKEAKAVVTQCSRESPENAGRFWQPSPEEIELLESRLSSYLKEQSDSGAQVPPSNTQYLRQYVGFFKGRERFIYGNFYPRRADPLKPDQNKAYVICDGGPKNWGVEYDPKAKKFSKLRLNGRV